MLKLYHAEPGANSLKCLIPLKEKELAFESVYVDLHKFEQHEPWFVAINPEGQARMRFWNKFVDEHVMNYVSMHGWHRFVGVLARGIEKGEFERLVARIPLHEQREKWRTARSGFSAADLENAKRKILVALDKVEDQLSRTPWLAGGMYTLADINFFSHCGLYVSRMFPDLTDERKHPRLSKWRSRIEERPGVKAALSMPDKTNPALRTFTGEVH